MRTNKKALNLEGSTRRYTKIVFKNKRLQIVIDRQEETVLIRSIEQALEDKSSF